MKLVAFHGKQSEKDALLRKLEGHYKADEFIKGTYWQNGKGCAVGCTIESGDHSQYEPRFGIPQVIAHLEDYLFENLENGESKEWPLQFVNAIKPGADLSGVWPAFSRWLLLDEKHGVIQYADTDQIRDAIKQVADLYEDFRPDQEDFRQLAESAWSAARSAARSAESAWSAAWSAARSARSAARSARSAAESAAWSAWSARSAARSAAWSAWSAWSAARSARSARSAARSAESAWSAARSAAESAAYKAQRDKLLELLANAPMAVA